MTPSVDRIHYLHLPHGQGGRAEQVRLVYVLAERPYEDVLHPTAQARPAVMGKNPFLQFPFVETPDGRFIPQTLAIMHHAAHGTPAWPADPARLTDALSVAVGAYDLYQAFGAFPATDLVAKQKFEERRAPQYFGGLAAIYAERPFAAGELPSFADCLTFEAIGWCVRRNEVCRGLFEASGPLSAFDERFRAIPRIAAFRARQAAARAVDPGV